MLAWSVAKAVFVIFCVVLPMVSYTVYAERRVSAAIQDRVGPNRTGFPTTLLGFKKDLQLFLGGLGQPIADAVKFILKEDFTPGGVKKFYFWLAPCLAMLPLVSLAFVPFGSTLFGEKMVIADINVSVLGVFAVTGVGVYAIVIAGWASNSKYPFLGGIRSSPRGAGGQAPPWSGPGQARSGRTEANRAAPGGLPQRMLSEPQVARAAPGARC